MKINHQSPLQVAAVPWHPGVGSHAVMVACKATYDLRREVSTLAAEQVPITYADVYVDKDPRKSLYLPSDMVPFKRKADVILVGEAYAPRREPVRSVAVRLTVGIVDKGFEVHVDRSWTQFGLLREGPRFVSMPLTFERAGGGPSSWNPVGVETPGKPDAYGNTSLPNLQPGGLFVSDPDDFVEPVGFGPIAPSWPDRRLRLGRHARRDGSLDWQSAPLPTDLDPLFFNCAPPDQQTDELQADERIVLENLHPDHPRFVTNLPGVYPSIQVDGGGPRAIILRCDTLWIDTARLVCTLTWRGQVTIDDPAKNVELNLTMVERAARPSRTSVEAPQLVSEIMAGPEPEKPFHIGRALLEERTIDARSQRAEIGTLPFVAPGENGTPRMPTEAVEPALRDQGLPWAGEVLIEPAYPITAIEPPAPVVKALYHDPTAVFAGVAAASDAALQMSANDGDHAALVTFTKAVPARPILMLSWVSPQLSGRLRRVKAWSAVLEAMEDEPIDPDLDRDLDPDVRDAFEVLARCAPSDGVRLREAFRSAVRPDGKLVPPLALVSGALELRPSSEVSNDAQAASVTEDFTKKTVFGGCHARGLVYLGFVDEAEVVPAYVPEAAWPMLPLLRWFDARILAEVHLRQDESEHHPLSLRVVAIARRVEDLTLEG